jgi:hypothetical protein
MIDLESGGDVSIKRLKEEVPPYSVENSNPRFKDPEMVQDKMKQI